MLTKRQQCGKHFRGKPQRAAMPEAALQSFVDDYLEANRIKFIRIPDQFWRFLYTTARPGILAGFRKIFGGQADNTAFIPISDKYSLALHLELKSTVGRLHGRQKIEAKKLPWQIARTPEDVMAIVQKFCEDADKLKGKS